MSTSENKGWVHFKGKHPAREGEQIFKFPTRNVLHLRTHGHEKKFCEIFSIESVLQNPAVIFEGLKREGLEEGFCYCGVPAVKYLTETVSVSVPPEMVFLIFATKDYEIFEFRWERMDATRPGFPTDHATRFNSIRWSHSSNS